MNKRQRVALKFGKFLKKKTWQIWKAKHLDLPDTNYQLPIANIKRVNWPQSRYMPGVNERRITKVNDPMSTWPHV